jgi:tetratricopeptide (TPR) repeat protein
VAGNPRIDELRKRLEREPQSRLFAQLAEELRKDGELEEAIGVAREGLQKHPNYPSARMTLGRALFDTGDWKAARTEFELVLKGAPDNILASRLLAESLESLGDVAQAVARYKATLALAPGDKQVLTRLKELESGRAAVGPGASGAEAAPPTAPPVPAAEPPPVPIAHVEGEMELERSPGEGRTSEPAPIPLVAADEHFELERPYEPPTPRTASAPAVPEKRPSPSPPLVSKVAEPEPLEVEFAPDLGGTTMPMGRPGAAGAAAVPVTAAPSAAEHTEFLTTEEFAAVAPTPGPSAERGSETATPSPDLASPTLAELYFKQGLTGKAVAVYRQLVEREPENGRLRDRLRELESLSARSGEAVPPPPTEEATGARRQAIERTIERLEGMLAVVRRG